MHDLGAARQEKKNKTNRKKTINPYNVLVIDVLILGYFHVDHLHISFREAATSNTVVWFLNFKFYSRVLYLY